MRKRCIQDFRWRRGRANPDRTRLFAVQLVAVRPVPPLHGRIKPRRQHVQHRFVYVVGRDESRDLCFLDPEHVDVLHHIVVFLTDGAGVPVLSRANCGAEFAYRHVELLAEPAGMPCEACLRHVPPAACEKSDEAAEY